MPVAGDFGCDIGDSVLNVDAPGTVSAHFRSPVSGCLLRVVQHRDADGYWRLVHAPPAPNLRSLVVGYCGYQEKTSAFLCRREFPSGRVVVIIDFGPALRVLDGPSAHAGQPVRSHPCGFVAGLHERFVVTETAGAQSGIEIQLTPLGAYRVFGVAMHDLANRVVGLTDLFGQAGADLADRLYHLAAWPQRFRMLDRLLTQRIARARPASEGLAWAWRRLEGSGGTAMMGDLAAELGWSRKHLIARFRDQIGLPPKRLARIIRFDRALDRLTQGTGQGLAGIAQDCGYADQAHLNRDFRQFTGGPPTDLLRRQLPDGGGIRGD